MKFIVLFIAKLILNFIYTILKLFPMQKNKITMLSRQSSQINIDFKMLSEEIKNRDANIKVTILCKKMPKKMIPMLGYCCYIMKCAYHIATSRVCIIDGYSIPISTLKHKKGLIIVQIWHAMGAIKKFGYQVIDKKEGYKQKTAQVMNMHKNYTFISCASEKTKQFYVRAFQVEPSKIEVLGMPRIDYLLGKNQQIEENASKILEKYPQLAKKKVILYAPTFRKGETIPIEHLIHSLDESKYELIIRLHPLDKTKVEESYILDKNIKTMDLLKIADYVITDYSAIAFEAAVLKKKLLFYVYDYKKYKAHRGLNIEPEKEMPSCTFEDATKMIKWLQEDHYPMQELENFQKKYVETLDCNNAKRIVDKILNLMEK